MGPFPGTGVITSATDEREKWRKGKKEEEKSGLKNMKEIQNQKYI